MQSESGGQPVAGSSASEKSKRVIKRYSNRKLYDTRDSRYVTLQQIGEMVRAGEEVQIIDNKTKEDKTEVTLALILSEDLRAQPRSVPLGALRDLIQERGGKWLTSLREGPIGRLIPGGAGNAEEATAEEPAPPPVEEKAAPADPKAGDKHAKNRLTEIVESSFSTIDERIRAILPGLLPGFLSSAKELKEQTDANKALEDEVGRLKARLEALETTVAALSKNKNGADKLSK